MQSWGTQREVEKVKPPSADKCLVVESGTCRMTVRALLDEDGVNIWLGMDHDSLPEFIIGQGRSANMALADAVTTLETIVGAMQSRRFPDDWKQDTLGRG